MEIVIPAEELAPLFEKAYREEARKIALPGFRKGKAPIQIIRKRFGQAIEADVLEKIANDYFKQALEERDIIPVSQPMLDDLDYKPGESATAKIRYETRPEVILEKYAGFQLDRLTHEVTDEEIDERINEMRKSLQTLEPADAADEEGYQVTCDILMLDADSNPRPKVPPIHETYDLGDENLNADLRAELLNIKSGETKDVEFHVEHNHEHDDEDADHEHVERYRIHVSKIERIILPELDDAFADKVSRGKFTTLDALRENTRADLNAWWIKHHQTELEEDLISQIILNNPMDVPPSFVERLVEESVKRLAQRYPNKKLPEGLDLEPFKKRERAQAERYIKWDFLSSQIAEKEGITVTDEDFDRHAEQKAQETGLDKELILNYLKSEQQEGTIRMEKIVAFLLEKSDIKELNDNEFRNEDMAPFSIGKTADAEFEDIPVESDEPEAAAETETDKKGE